MSAHEHATQEHATHAHGPHAHHDPALVIARAERYSREQGLSFTPMRRRVLGELLAANAPVTAYDLADRLSTERRVAPVQIYRALDFLMEAGVAHRLATRSAFMACGHEHGDGETTVFLVCGSCGTVAEITSDAVGRSLEDAASASGFEAHHPVVEVEGRCAACRG